MFNIQTIFTNLWDTIRNHIFDWIITGIVTYFTVKSATKHYYYKTRKQIAHDIMELGLRSMYTLPYSKELPNTAKVIFVEYGKHSLFMDKKQLADSKCGNRALCNLRETVESCGRSKMDISKYRPKDYGVLGLSNKNGKALIFDFSKGELLQFSNGEFHPMEVITKDGNYMHGDHVLSKTTGNERSVMIAVPILRDYGGSKLLGGVTFDIEPNDTTVYKSIDINDPPDIMEEKKLSNKRVVETAINTSIYLRTAYFNERGGQTE